MLHNVLGIMKAESRQASIMLNHDGMAWQVSLISEQCEIDFIVMLILQVKKMILRKYKVTKLTNDVVRLQSQLT